MNSAEHQPPRTAHFFRASFDALDTPIAVLDASGQALFVNRAWQRFAAGDCAPPFAVSGGGNYLLACEQAAAQGDSSAAALLEGARAVLSGERESFETIYACRTVGRGGVTPPLLWLAVRITRFVGEVGAGSPRPYLLVSQSDVSLLQQTDHALRDSEARYRQLFEQASEGIAITDPGRRFVEVNALYCEMLGYTHAELLAMTLDDVMPQEAAQRLSLDDLRAGKAVLAERLLRRKDGARVPVELTARTLPDGNIQVLIRDISERRRAEEQIGRHANQTALLDEVSQALARSTLDYEGVLEMVVQRAAELLDGTCLITLLSDDGQSMWVPAIGSVEPGVRAAAAGVLGRVHWFTPGIAMSIRETGQPVFLPRVSSAELRPRAHPVYHRLLDQFEVRSLMTAPLRAQGRIIGGLTAARVVSAVPYAEDDLRFLQAVADRAALAIVTAAQYRQIQRRLQESTALADISRALSETLELDRILQLIVDAARRIIPQVHRAVIHLLDADGQTLKPVATAGLAEGNKAELTMRPGEGVAGHALEKGALVNVGDVQNDARYIPSALDMDLRSLMAAPVQSGSQQMGTISVASAAPNAFSPDDENLLAQLSVQAALAITNARIYQQEREQRALAEALRDTAAALNSTLDFDEVLHHILENLTQVVPCDLSQIILLEGEQARIAGYHCAPAYRLPGWHPLRHMPLAEWFNLVEMRRSGQPFIVPDTRAEPRWRFYPETEWIRSNVGAPIRVKERVIGFLSLDSATPRFFDAQHAARLQAFADQAAVSLENARLLADAEQRAREFASLHETTRDLGAHYDLQALLQLIATRTRALLNAESCSVVLYDAARGDLELVAGEGLRIPLGTRSLLGAGATGYAAQSRQPVRVNDYRASAYFNPHFAQIDLAAVLRVPMLHQGELIGVIAASEYGDSPRKFTDDDERLLSLFAAQAAGAVHNARLLQETTRRAREFETLYDVTRNLGTQYDLQALLQNVVMEAATLLRAPTGGVALYDAARGDLEVVAGIKPLAPVGSRIALDFGLMGQAVRTRQPARMNDYAHWAERPREYSSFALRAAIAAPMLYGGELIGVLALGETDAAHQFSDADERLLSLFAAQAAGAVHNARLFQSERRRLQEIIALQHVTEAISAHLDERALLDAVTVAVAEVSRYQCVSVYLAEADGLRRAAHTGAGLTEPPVLLPRGQGVVGRAAQSGEPALVPDVSADADSGETSGAKAVAAVPLRLGAQLIGALVVRAAEAHTLTTSDLEWLGTVSRQLGVALENARFYSDLQRALAQEQKTRAQLVQADKLAIMGRMVATVAHELSNPLQSIVNVLHLLQADSPPGAPVQELLELALAEAKRISTLVVQLRATYRPTTAEQMRTLDLVVLLAEVRALVEPHLLKNRVRWQSSAAPESLPVAGVADQLKQVFINLSLNAMEAMAPAGGALSIGIIAPSGADEVGVTVTDTGHGIAPENLPHVFEPFFTTKESGTGLGLAICYDIVQKHGGRIEVASEVGKGTRFVVWLARAPDDA